jgi:Uma2 family endonuclease
MSIASFSNLDLWGIPPEPVRRITVDEYHQMIEAEVIGADDRCELIEGWLLPKMPHKPSHDFVVSRINRLFTMAMGDDWVIRIQSAFSLPDGEPEPDVVVCKGPDSLYAMRHPAAKDTPILIEVSDSTLTRDRGIKLQSYARAGIPEYWIVNLVERQIEIYSQPDSNNSRYGEPRIVMPEEQVSVVLEGKTWLMLPARELLP